MKELNIPDDEPALCISDHELAHFYSHHELSLYVWDYRKRPDHGRYRERPDQSHSAAHSKINQVKSAEKASEGIARGQNPQIRSFLNLVHGEPCLRQDQYFGPAQADPAQPGSISSSCIWGLCSLHRRLSISKHKLVLRISDHHGIGLH